MLVLVILWSVPAIGIFHDLVAQLRRLFKTGSNAGGMARIACISEPADTNQFIYIWSVIYVSRVSVTCGPEEAAVR